MPLAHNISHFGGIRRGRKRRLVCRYLIYTVLDIFSGYVVGWMIAEVESSELAKQLIAETACKQRIQPDQLTLHADNGSPMNGKPLRQLLLDLGITKSHSRLHTSDDNPFSEAQFIMMKYRADYPEHFGLIDQARQWAHCYLIGITTTILIPG